MTVAYISCWPEKHASSMLRRNIVPLTSILFVVTLSIVCVANNVRSSSSSITTSTRAESAGPGPGVGIDGARNVRSSAAASPSGFPSGTVGEMLFEDFIMKFNKTYRNGTREYYHRFQIFKDSLQRLTLLNAMATHPESAVYGITKFSDLTTEEFASQYLGSVPHPRQGLPEKPPNKAVAPPRGKPVPAMYDMRQIKPSVITPVKNQKSCGACWAFSVVECVETKIALKTKRLTALSPQELVDCGTAAGDSGCRGGVPCRTLDWLNRTKTTLVPESTYPYTGQKGNCKIISNSTLNAVVSDYSCANYSSNEEVAMPSLLYKEGPLSVSVDAQSWQYYLGGIIQYHCIPTFLNHAVQIVGYDKTGDIPYYIVRNSWGANWGISGYLHIKIGNDVCGIASAVQTVSV